MSSTSWCPAPRPSGGHACRSATGTVRPPSSTPMTSRPAPARRPPVRPPDLTFAKLFDMYEREVTPSKSMGAQKHDRCAQALFERCWGGASVVKALDRRDWDRFIRLRRAGQLKPEQGRHKGGVRDRIIEQDLRFLIAVCNWALTVRENGEPLLTSNPFRGFPVPAEQNINQPVTPDEEVARMRAVAADVHQLCPVYFELTYHSGHRCMAVGRLRWSDVDFSAGTVCCQAKHDKMGFEHVVPLDEAVLELLRLGGGSLPCSGTRGSFPRRPIPVAHPQGIWYATGGRTSRRRRASPMSKAAAGIACAGGSRPIWTICR